MSDNKRALLLLDRNTPTIAAIVYSDSLDVELTLAELRERFEVVNLDEKTGDINLRDVEAGESYNELTLPKNHALVFDEPSILIVPVDKVFDNYYPIADFTGEYNDHHAENSVNDLVNDLTLRVAKLEEVYKSLTAKPRQKTTKQDTTDESEQTTA